MKKSITIFIILIIFLAGLYSGRYFHAKDQNGASKQNTEVTVSHAFDSLANQTITEEFVSPELLWKFGRIGEFRLSPDGKTVVFSVTRYSTSENKGYTELFTCPASGGETKRLTTLNGNEWNPRWQHGGEKIGFISAESGSAQLWEINPDGSGANKVSDIEGGINSFEYSPAGNLIFYCKDVKVRKTPAEVHNDLPKSNVYMASELMYRHWNHWEDEFVSHIFTCKFENGKLVELKDIMDGEPYDSPLSPYFDSEEISWSKDEKYIAYTCKKINPNEYAVSTNSDIYLYDVEKGITTNLTEGMPGYDRYPVFSPDGKFLAWQSMETPGYESDKQRLFIIDLKTGERKDLTANFDQNASVFRWNKECNKVYFISGIRATEQVYCADIETGFIKQLTSGKHDYTALELSGESLVGTRMSMSQATEIYRIDVNTGAETQLTFTNRNIYEKVKMGVSKERWITTTDNKKMLVWFIYPPDFDSTKVYPALLYCQGGPQSTVSQFFSYRWNFQIMAANGYIIVAPNRRGLPSFGHEWNKQISGDYGGQNMKDYLSAIDNAVQEKYINKSRLGCIGASYGGFSVFWLAGNHQKRFKAFIAHCGMFNLESQYAGTEEVFFTNYDLGGSFWDKNNKVAQNSYSNSPHKFVQNWDTPIMVISGMGDFRIPYTESLQAYNCARLKGIPAKLLIFPEETHFVLKPQNSILWQREFFGWLDKWLK